MHEQLVKLLARQWWRAICPVIRWEFLTNGYRQGAEIVLRHKWIPPLRQAHSSQVKNPGLLGVHGYLRFWYDIESHSDIAIVTYSSCYLLGTRERTLIFFLNVNSYRAVATWYWRTIIFSILSCNRSSRRLLGKSYLINTLVMSLVMKRYSSKSHFTAFLP